MSVKSCLRRTFLIKLKKNNLFIQGCKAAGNAIDNASKKSKILSLSTQLIVTARDDGRPMTLLSTCNLEINVKNVNDNEPTFVNPPFNDSMIYASTTAQSRVFITLKVRISLRCFGEDLYLLRSSVVGN